MARHAGAGAAPDPLPQPAGRRRPDAAREAAGRRAAAARRLRRRLDATLTAQALLFYAPALFAHSGIEILSRGFYALGDTKTPVAIAVASMLINVALAAALVGPLEVRGLALALSLATTLEFAALYFAGLEAHTRPGCGRHGLVARSAMALAAGVMAAAAGGCLAALRYGAGLDLHRGVDALAVRRLSALQRRRRSAALYAGLGVARAAGAATEPRYAAAAPADACRCAVTAAAVSAQTEHSSMLYRYGDLLARPRLLPSARPRRHRPDRPLPALHRLQDRQGQRRHRHDQPQPPGEQLSRGRSPATPSSSPARASTRSPAC